ncbi:MAG: DUF542 domain-containing protein [Vicinamibacterales bacterium]
MTTITATTPVEDIARSAPATIRVFQRHHIDFCCTASMPLTEACAARGLDTARVLAELQSALEDDTLDPAEVLASQPLGVIIRHIQAHYHEPLRAELPRLDAMLARVVERHGARLPDVLPPLRQTFVQLSQELLDHMAREDEVLFPAIEALETRQATPFTPDLLAHGPIAMMEEDHDAAMAALRHIRRLTQGYAPPEWACPTFRGLYFGLAELERDMTRHVTLENEVLFRRAAALPAPGRGW